MTPRSAPVLLLALALLPRIAAATTTPASYVLTINHLNVQAFDDREGIAASGATYNSGDLPQMSDSYSNDVMAEGYLSGVYQEAAGSITSTANVGDLHAIVHAEATTSNYYYGDFSQATARSTSMSYTAWFETVTFHTSNPSGSLFTAEISLSDSIVNSAIASDAAGFAAGSGVRVMLDIHGLPLVSDPTLIIDDNEFINNDGRTVTLPDSFERNYTFLALNGTTLTFLESLDITTSAGGGDTQSTADVGNTAHFALFSSDTGASYTTSSGVVFDTAIVPEPTTAALLFPSLLLLRKRQP